MNGMSLEEDLKALAKKHGRTKIQLLKDFIGADTHEEMFPSGLVSGPDQRVDVYLTWNRKNKITCEEGFVDLTICDGTSSHSVVMIDPRKLVDVASWMLAFAEWAAREKAKEKFE